MIICICMTDCIKISLIAPPFSINKAYYKNRQRTKECREWGDNILKQLKSFENDILGFTENFNELKDSIHISLCFYIPENIFYTKSGKISRRSNDLTNIEKLLVDLIFDSRFYDRGFINLNIDDCLISKLSSEKKPTKKDYYIDIIIQKVANTL